MTLFMQIVLPYLISWSVFNTRNITTVGNLFNTMQFEYALIGLNMQDFGIMKFLKSSIINFVLLLHFYGGWPVFLLFCFYGIRVFKRFSL